MSVLAAVRAIVRRIGIEQACLILRDSEGEPLRPGTLRNRMSGVGAHSFSLEHAVTLTCETGDLSIVNAMCMEAGIPAPMAKAEPAEGSFMRVMSTISTHKAAWMGEMTKALDDDTVTENELDACEAALSDLLQTVQAAHAKLRAKHEADKARAMSLVRSA